MTKIRVTLVGFDDDLSKKFIPIGVDETTVDLSNFTTIDQLNNAHLIHWY